MAWTERPDSAPCCPGPRGAVAETEHVARLLHSNIDHPDIAPFQRKDLTGEGLSRVPSDACGDADGCSVNRADGLDDADLRSMSESQAARGSKPRQASGAVVANVSAIRALRRIDSTDEQVVFVYDDPMVGNDRHAVLRVVQGLPRADFKELQKRLAETFARRVA